MPAGPYTIAAAEARHMNRVIGRLINTTNEAGAPVHIRPYVYNHQNFKRSFYVKQVDSGDFCLVPNGREWMRTLNDAGDHMQRPSFYVGQHKGTSEQTTAFHDRVRRARLRAVREDQQRRRQAIQDRIRQDQELEDLNQQIRRNRVEADARRAQEAAAEAGVSAAEILENVAGMIHGIFGGIRGMANAGQPPPLPPHPPPPPPSRQPSRAAGSAPSWTSKLKTVQGSSSSASPSGPESMEQMSCSICLGDDAQHRRTVLCLPCSHLCMCAFCAKRMGGKKCPICSEGVEKLVFVFV
jgi:hypothetical protein